MRFTYVGTGGEVGDRERGAYRSLVSSSAKRWTSSYSRVPRHSGHLISFQRRLLRSVRIDVARQSWQVDGSWLQVFVMAAEGNSNTGLVSVQMMHSRSPLRMSGNLRWLVMMTEDVASATRYRCPNLNGGLAERIGSLGASNGPEVIRGKGRGDIGGDSRCWASEICYRHRVLLVLDGGGVRVV